jgi:arylsulfatase A-like enzyme
MPARNVRLEIAAVPPAIFEIPLIFPCGGPDFSLNTGPLAGKAASPRRPLKPLGYATGQFGKNHLGDRNEFLPTVHGFDEFHGNLYHLNAEEEPELPDYPKDPAFRAKYGPRGVLDCKASDKDDPTVDPRFGKVGKQVCKDTGPLNRERMLTIDDDIANRAAEFIKRQNAAGKPVFV